MGSNIPQVPGSEDYIGLQKAANEFAYYPQQIYRLVKRGKLPAVRFGDKLFVKRNDVANLKTTLKHKKLPAG